MNIDLFIYVALAASVFIGLSISMAVTALWIEITTMNSAISIVIDKVFGFKPEDY